jgi:quercetin dioxygenase-like cupin family protein
MKLIMRVSIAMLMPMLVLMANGAAFGQELPPGPAVVSRTSLPGQTINGEFELINIILDFDPGAATPRHTHGGPGMVTVLTEEMTFGMEGMPDLVARPGEVYHDLPGMVHTAANKGPNTSRVSYMVALPKGAALTTVVGAAQGADLPPGPKTVYRNSLPGLTLQGEFEMINLILELAPGAATPMHTHGGPGIVTVLEGELAFGGEGKPDMVAKPGQVFLDLPGTHHTATNKSSAPARVSYAVLLPKGATLTTVDAAPSPAQAEAPAQQPAAPPAEFVGMPSTGEGVH